MSDNELAFNFDEGPSSTPQREPEQVLSEAPKTTKRVVVTLDNTPQDVIRLNDEGAELYFDDSAEGFLDLSEDVRNALSTINKTRYLVACGVHARTVDEKSHPENLRTPGLEISGRLASATARMDVRKKEPGMHYCWKRPDELRQAGYEGFQIASEKELVTFGSSVGSTRTVGAAGDVELVLMKIPQETADQRQRAVESKSKSRVENVERSTAEDIRRSGGKPLIPDEHDKARNWS